MELPDSKRTHCKLRLYLVSLPLPMVTLRLKLLGIAEVLGDAVYQYS